MSDDAATPATGDEEPGASLDPGGREPRHERMTVHEAPGPANSLRRWWGVRSVLRLAVNVVVVVASRYSPSFRLKNWCFRRLGMTVGPRVAFALESTPDVVFPELITVEADALVGYDATILGHEFLQDEYRTGEVVIGERAVIGAGAVVLPGVRIGADAKVGANAVVTRDVPPGATVVGVPAEPVEET